MGRISEFLLDAHEEDADLLIVATTRPRGYAGEFTPEYYEHLSLLDLEQPDALQYAERLADVRHDGDPEVRRQTMERLGEAADDELTARLMRTPLQVTIMSLLLEGRARVPRERYGLFSAYYSTIYELLDHLRARSRAAPSRARRRRARTPLLRRIQRGRRGGPQRQAAPRGDRTAGSHRPQKRS